MTRTWTGFLVGSWLAFGAPLAHGETVLITGANSGLGLEFVKQYAAKGWTVIATHRRNDLPESLAAVQALHKNVRVEHLDVADLADIKAAATKLKGLAIDVLINNAGVYSDRSVCTDESCRGDGDTQSFGNMDYALFDQIMTVNVRAITFTFGGSGAIAYRASKAALNRSFQLVAVKEKTEGVTVLMLHPGAVLTERQANLKFPGMVEMQPSVTGMISVIDKATLADTGRFIQYDGTTAPW